MFVRGDTARLSLTIHLNGEDTLLTARPHGRLDAGLAHQVVVEGVLPVGEIHAAHLARETPVVPAQTAAQCDLLYRRTDISERKSILTNYLAQLHPFLAALALVQRLVLLALLTVRVVPGERNNSRPDNTQCGSVAQHSQEKVKTNNNSQGKTLSCHDRTSMGSEQ